MPVGIPAEEQLRQNVLELMRIYGWTQVELARRLGKNQPWLSRRLRPRDSADPEDAERCTRFQIEDLDLLAAVFGLAPAELLQPGYGKWDRRSSVQRRTGQDRRKSPRSVTAAEREILIPRRVDNRIELHPEPLIRKPESA